MRLSRVLDFGFSLLLLMPATSVGSSHHLQCGLLEQNKKPQHDVKCKRHVSPSHTNTTQFVDGPQQTFQNVAVLQPQQNVPISVATLEDLMSISMLSCGTNLYPSKAVIFSLYGAREEVGYLPYSAKWKNIRYKHKGLSMRSFFDPKTEEFVATASGFYAFNWEGEKASDFAPAQVRVMKNSKLLVGKGVMRKGERGLVRIFSHVWLIEGDRISTSYRGTFSSGKRVPEEAAVSNSTGTVIGAPSPSVLEEQKRKIRKRNYEPRSFRHPALLRFSGHLLIASPTPVQVPCGPDLCSAPGRPFIAIQPSASKSRKLASNTEQNVTASSVASIQQVLLQQQPRQLTGVPSFIKTS